MSLIQDYFSSRKIPQGSIMHHESAFNFFEWWLRLNSFEPVKSPRLESWRFQKRQSAPEYLEKKPESG